MRHRISIDPILVNNHRVVEWQIWVKTMQIVDEEYNWRKEEEHKVYVKKERERPTKETEERQDFRRNVIVKCKGRSARDVRTSNRLLQSKKKNRRGKEKHSSNSIKEDKMKKGETEGAGSELPFTLVLEEKQT